MHELQSDGWILANSDSNTSEKAFTKAVELGGDKRRIRGH